MFVGIQGSDELEAIAGQIDAPIMLGGASANLHDLEYLAQCGVRICLQGHQPYLASVQATYDSLKALREGTPPSQLTGIVSTDLIKQLTRDEDYQQWQDEFL